MSQCETPEVSIEDKDLNDPGFGKNLIKKHFIDPMREIIVRHTVNTHTSAGRSRGVGAWLLNVGGGGGSNHRPFSSLRFRPTAAAEAGTQTRLVFL